MPASQKPNEFINNFRTPFGLLFVSWGGLSHVPDLFGGCQVNGHKLADPFFHHRDTEQAGHAGHGVGMVRDDEEPGVGCACHLVHHVTEAVHVRIVERRIDFVEHADRGRVGQEYREGERGCGQGLFAAREEAERIWFFAGWTATIHLKPA